MNLMHSTYQKKLDPQSTIFSVVSTMIQEFTLTQNKQPYLIKTTRYYMVIISIYFDFSCKTIYLIPETNKSPCLCRKTNNDFLRSSFNYIHFEQTILPKSHSFWNPPLNLLFVIFKFLQICGNFIQFKSRDRKRLVITHLKKFLQTCNKITLDLGHRFHDHK